MMTPTYASRDTPQTIKIIAETKTDAERIASKDASSPEATSAPEFKCFPCFFTYYPRISFATIATAITTKNVEL